MYRIYSLHVLALLVMLVMCCRALLIVVNPSGSAAKDFSTTAAEKHWKDASAQVVEEAGASQSSKEVPDLEFDVTYVQTNVDACKAIHRALSKLRSVLLANCDMCSKALWPLQLGYDVLAGLCYSPARYSCLCI